LLECAGLVALLAEKPGDPQVYMLLRIISAGHRGLIETLPNHPRD